MLLFSACMPAWSQPPGGAGDAVKEVDRAVPEEAIERRLIRPSKKPPKIEEEPEKPEKPTGREFFIKNIVLEGVESLPPENFDPILEEYKNRKVRLSELKILAKKIERAYLDEGIIAACIIPPQDIADDTLIIKVIESRMGALEIGGTGYFSKDRVAYYWRMEPGDILRYDKISRSLQFMNKNPDRYTKATLHAGEKPGTTDVLLNVDAKFPFHITASLDREGQQATGKLRRGLGFIHNDLLGMDDTLIAGYTGGKFFGSGYAYHKIPITNYGTAIMYGYSQTEAAPKGDYRLYGIRSKTQNTLVSVYQDLYYKEDYIGEINTKLEIKNKSSTWTDGTLNRDRLRIIRVGGLLLGKGNRSIAYIMPEYSQGLNFLGARRISEFSSRDASNTFSKVNLTASFRKSLVKGIQTNFKFVGQLAGQGLTPQEEMYLGGLASVRGYPDGDYLADTGLYTNMELHIPAFFLSENLKFPYGSKPLKDEITGILFFDYGWGMKRNASGTEIGKRKLASLGAGLRFRLFDQATLRLEWGWPMDGYGWADSPYTEFAHSRFHFSLDFQDDIPEEIQRIYGEMKENNIKSESWSILNSEMKKPDSPLRKKLHKYYYLAKEYEKNLDYKKAKEYYYKTMTAGKSIYRQTEAYVKDTIRQRNSLENDMNVAAMLNKNGEHKKAKEVWQNVAENAKIKPLILEVL